VDGAAARRRQDACRPGDRGAAAGRRRGRPGRRARPQRRHRGAVGGAGRGAGGPGHRVDLPVGGGLRPRRRGRRGRRRALPGRPPARERPGTGGGAARRRPAPAGARRVPPPPRGVGSAARRPARGAPAGTGAGAHGHATRSAQRRPGRAGADAVRGDGLRGDHPGGGARGRPRTVRGAGLAGHAHPARAGLGRQQRGALRRAGHRPGRPGVRLGVVPHLAGPAPGDPRRGGGGGLLGHAGRRRAGAHRRRPAPAPRRPARAAAGGQADRGAPARPRCRRLGGAGR